MARHLSRLAMSVLSFDRCIDQGCERAKHCFPLCAGVHSFSECHRATCKGLVYLPQLRDAVPRLNLTPNTEG
jgi:hypothetical protein